MFSIIEILKGMDGRLSNSKTQAAVWFFVLIVSYLVVTLLRVRSAGMTFLGGVSIPENLLYLSGFSVLTYGGAKAITQGQVNADPGAKPGALAGSVRLANYFTDDADNVDFGDFQMTMITLFVFVIYVLQVFEFCGHIELARDIVLPDIDSTLLSLFGLSQSAYLFKKVAAVATVRSAASAPDGQKGSGR
ncbi:MAG: hypothetical protein ACKOCM_02895 [Cyanobacteriota bacterium]